MKFNAVMLIPLMFVFALPHSLQAEGFGKARGLNRFSAPIEGVSSDIGFYSDNEFAYLFGMSKVNGLNGAVLNNQEEILSFTTTNGIQYDNISVGIGTGVNFWKGDPLYPIVLSAKYEFPIQGLSPYVEGNGGFLHGKRERNLFGDPETSQWMLSIGVGVKYKLNKKLNLFGKAMYSYRSFKAEHRVENRYDYVQTYYTDYSFLRVSLGLNFGTL